LDLSGPSFLAAYLGCALALALLKTGLVLVLRHPSRISVRDKMLSFEPYEVAYLSGGSRAVTDAAVTALVHAGQAAIEKGRLTKTPSTGGGAFIQPGVYRQVEAPDKHPVELVIRAALASRGSLTLQDARDASRMTAENVGTTLAKRGNFVLSDATQRVGVALGVIPLCGLFALGFIKLMLGIDRGRPVFFLMFLLAGTAYWLYRQGLSFPRLTFSGEAALDALRRENAALQTAMRAAPEQVTSREAALGYGLFGTTVLGGSLGVLATPLFLGSSFGQKPRDDKSTGSGCGGGTSCGGGSCGGGCGGGCGGCGG
jgi:uncharacterized protein (TIGR04222 family)